MEILAPVGGQPQLNAAIAAGADAIYLGNDKFSARAGAENFNIDDIADVVTRCHFENIKVYVTVNTLFKDSEIYDALNLCVSLANRGVDAIIIQDFGLLHLLETYYPDIEKHASTQMSIHNIDGAKFVKNSGISRVVLARELSIDEIAQINNAGIETEVFVHGAICISYSGQCLFSSLNGTRSANRGRCAQPCRKPYKLLKNDEVIDNGFLISPKDRAYIDNITQLKDIGVSSFKIEGRLRNEYYVYESIIQYKNALYQKSYDISKLAQIFKREEFSNDYLFNNPDNSFITKSGGSNKGIYLGTVKNGVVKLHCDIQLSDGIKANKGGFILTKMLRNDKKITSAHAGDVVKLFPTKYKDGDILFKTASFHQKKSIDEAIKNYSPTQKIIDVDIEFKVNQPITISESSASEKIICTGDIVEPAIKKPLDKNRIIENIEKSGSPYIKLRANTINVEEGFLRMSAINDIRRQFIAEYEDKYITKTKSINNIDIPSNPVTQPNSPNKLLSDNMMKKTTDIKQDNNLTPSENSSMKMIIISKTWELSAFDSDLTVCINPFSAQNGSLNMSDILELDKQGHKYYIKIPTIIRNEIDEIYDFLMSLDNILGVVTANLGVISRLKGKLSLIGYYDLNIMNSHAIEFFDDMDYIIPSVEMCEKDLSSLINKQKLMPIVYGNLKYMNMEYSPIDKFIPAHTNEHTNLTHDNKLHKDAIHQNNDDNAYTNYYLEENGRKTIIQKDVFGRTTLYSYTPLNHSFILDKYKNMGYSNFVIEPICYAEHTDNPATIKNTFNTIINGFAKERGFLQEELIHYNRGIL